MDTGVSPNGPASLMRGHQRFDLAPQRADRRRRRRPGKTSRICGIARQRGMEDLGDLPPALRRHESAPPGAA